MTKAQHTPGPWKATKDPHGTSSDYCIGMATDVARIDRVAVCSERDASLIAAAPCLLDALKGMLEVFGDEFGMGDSSVCDDARAAISKATRSKQ